MPLPHSKSTRRRKRRRTRVAPGRDLGAGTDAGRREDLAPQKVQGRDLESPINEFFNAEDDATLADNLQRFIEHGIGNMAFGCEKISAAAVH